MSPDSLKELVRHYPRVAITGAPRSGKTTLALKAAAYATILHSDEIRRLMGDSRSEPLIRSAAAVRGPLVIEGSLLPLALARGLGVDALVVLPARDPLTCAQRARWKRCEALLRNLEELGRLPYVFFGARWRSAS